MEREPPEEGMAGTPRNEAEQGKIAQLVRERCVRGCFGVQVLTITYQDGTIAAVREGFDRQVA